MKEPYIKPEIKSENLKPEALANPGSPVDGGNGNGTSATNWPR